MKVHIKAFAALGDILGKDMDLEIKDGSTVGDLLQSIISTNKLLEAAIFDDDGSIREHVILMKNGKKIDQLDGLGTELRDGDILAILPPVSGG